MNDPNSSWFIGFDWFLHASAAFLSYFENFLKFKMVDLISWGDPTLHNDSVISSLLLYFSFKKLNDANSSSFIRFDWTLRDSALLFSYIENLFKFKSGGPNLLGGTNSGEWVNKLVPPSKSWTTQIFRHSLDLIEFYKIQQYFSHILKIPSNSRG